MIGVSVAMTILAWYMAFESARTARPRVKWDEAAVAASALVIALSGIGYWLEALVRWVLS